eukprot:Phypoly_transcript_05642.p1 GENE.Phypoly_transcript_05642~~Phypoly_transcript_05642.p1  ORF type:complete len:536 (+),score=74.36 Phypoly_transcript_05642:15-1622(+)
MYLPVVLLLLCSFVCLHATQIFVTTTNITQALATAADGDEFVLSNGTYPNLNFTMYGMSLSFISASGNPGDVIIDGEGRNGVVPFQLYYNSLLTNLTANISTPTSLSISGITLKNCGTVESDADIAQDFQGGAIYAFSYNVSSISINISNCIFQGGFAGIGGQLFLEEGDGPINLSISNTSFSGSTAFFGAAIFAGGPHVTLNITSSSFINLNSYIVGGIHLAEATLYFSDSSVTESSAGQSSYVDAEENLGGAALYMEVGSTAYISNLLFANNKGIYEGAIYSAGDLTILHSTFRDNRAQQSAGSVGTGIGHLTIVGCTFNQESALFVGGAIHTQLTTGLIANSTFTLCTLDGTDSIGGAAYFLLSTLTVDNCTFSQNSAVFGGALLSENSTVYLINSNFMQNFAVLGGALYVESSEVVVLNGSIYANTAYDYGGGVFVDVDGSLTLQDSIVSGNMASRGASLFCVGGSIDLNGSTVNATYDPSSGDVNGNGLYCHPTEKDTECTITATNTPGNWDNLCQFQETPKGKKSSIYL